MKEIIGIDYGSKLAGTTVIAIYKAHSFQFFQSVKGQDADRFLVDALQNSPPAVIGLDAPLSLPGKLRELAGFSDYFYRQSDRELKAMSPMFLGGLTARAIRIKDLLEAEGHQVIETWPSVWADRLNLKPAGYKKGGKEALSDVTSRVCSALSLELPRQDIPTWHHLDSMLCCWSAFRHYHGKTETFGDPREGLILI